MFSQDTSRDMVKDFQNGVDLLQISGASDFSQLNISQLGGGDIEILFSGQKIILSNPDQPILLADIGAEDFLFL